jgi:hypothetical protein
VAAHEVSSTCARRGLDRLGSLAGVGLGRAARANARLVDAAVALCALDDGVVLAGGFWSSKISTAPHTERIGALRIALLDDLPARQRATAARGRIDGARRRRRHLGDATREAQQDELSQHASTIRQDAALVAEATRCGRAAAWIRKPGTSRIGNLKRDLAVPAAWIVGAVTCPPRPRRADHRVGSRWMYNALPAAMKAEYVVFTAPEYPLDAWLQCSRDCTPVKCS